MRKHTKKDKIRNDHIWDQVGAAFVLDKMREVMPETVRACEEVKVRRCERLAMADEEG